MAILGISTFENQEYISEKDPAKTKEEGATVFILGSLDVDIKAKLTDRSFSMEVGSGDQKINSQNNTVALDAVRFGLRGWENFKDKDGKAIPFKSEETLIGGRMYSVVSQKTLNSLPIDLIVELGNKIMRVNTVSEQVEKNSKTE